MPVTFRDNSILFHTGLVSFDTDCCCETEFPFCGGCPGPEVPPAIWTIQIQGVTQGPVFCNPNCTTLNDTFEISGTSIHPTACLWPDTGPFFCLYNEDPETTLGVGIHNLGGGQQFIEVFIDNESASGLLQASWNTTRPMQPCSNIAGLVLPFDPTSFLQTFDECRFNGSTATLWAGTL